VDAKNEHITTQCVTFFEGKNDRLKVEATERTKAFKKLESQVGKL